MIENGKYIYRNIKFTGTLLVLGFLLGVLIGYTTSDVKVNEFSIKKNFRTSFGNSVQNKNILKAN